MIGAGPQRAQGSLLLRSDQGNTYFKHGFITLLNSQIVTERWVEPVYLNP
ncbi:hypothetical protein J577_0863 [Acinetobacter sp. 263903-1]|nr:hypothetical protein J546_2625 [Acinetobacter sp. 1461402]EXB69260.1 hypothetical protein J550_2751 [Acinetobacter sp. 230853]EXB86603.1 hypothetical protein J538_1289 [Acinetobacter sp. 272263]EXC33668.1 hypothetical protein J520_0833 [Acinetobacter sp. 869535]EXE13625.1 hypothetical protein J559_2181 [Acinetobacter sp. 983759]KCX38483.1 hypothetical protein J577_0863 [Acinetobacter sp. 263903-1]